MSLIDRDWFVVNKKNYEDRVKTYTIPGVQEVIFKDEWVPKPMKKIIKLSLYQKLVNKIWVLYIKIRRG